MSLWHNHLKWRSVATTTKFHDAILKHRNITKIAAEMGVGYSTVRRRLNELVEFHEECRALLAENRDGQGAPEKP